MILTQTRVSIRMIIRKILLQNYLSHLVYLSECDLDDIQKDKCYDSLINVVRRLEKKEIEVIATHFTGNAESVAANFKDKHGIYGYGIKNKERGIFWSFVWL